MHIKFGFNISKEKKVSENNVTNKRVNFTEEIVNPSLLLCM